MRDHLAGSSSQYRLSRTAGVSNMLSQILKLSKKGVGPVRSDAHRCVNMLV